MSNPHKKYSLRVPNEFKQFFYQNKIDIIKESINLLEQNIVNNEKIKYIDENINYGTICTFDVPYDLSNKLLELCNTKKVKVSKLLRFVMYNLKNKNTS